MAMRRVAIALALVCVAALCCVSTVSAAFYDKGSGVTVLTSKNFDSTVKVDGQIYLVEFYAPWCGHCKSLAPEWMKAAKSLAGVVGVGALDCDEEANKPLAAKYGIKGFPTIKLFVGKSDKPKDYNGERTAKAIADWALTQIPSAVKKVSDKTVGEFFRSNGDLPKALLFTKKAVTAPMYKSLSTRLQKRMILAEISEKEGRKTLDQFGISEDDLPLLLAFPKGHDAADPTASAIRYSGKLNSKPLYAWLRQYALPGGDETKEESEPVPELQDQSCLQTLCMDESGLCAVVVLSGSASDADNSKYLAQWKQAQLSREDNFFQFVWLNGVTHASFIDKAFAMQPADYPQVIALNAKKLKYTPFVGSFTVDSIGEFLESVLRGRGAIPLNSAKLPELPTDTKKCTPKPKPKEEDKPKPQQQQQQQQQQSGGAKTGATSGEAGVSEVLTAANFEKKVLSSKQPWIVEFFAPWCGHCKTLAPEWAKASASLKNMVKFGAVDATVEQQLASQYGIKGYPTIKYFPAGVTGKTKKDKVADYQGQRTSAALSQHALSLLSSKLVKSLSGGREALGKWAAAGSASTGSATARVLLFSNKPQVPSLLSALSIEFEGEAAFAFVKNSESELVSAFNVTQFPSMFVLKALESPTGNLEVNGIPNNALSFNSISTILTQFLGGRGGAKAGGSSSGSADSGSGSDAKADKPEETGPLVADVFNSKDFDDYCTSKVSGNAGTCIVAVLNPEAREASSAQYVRMIDGIAKAQRTKRAGIRFVRFEREAQPQFISAFDVSEAGAISVVAVLPKAKRFATFIGAFEADGLTQWIEGIAKGSTKTFPYKSFPPLQQAPTPDRASNTVPQPPPEGKPGKHPKDEL